jgi:hypothetical protein
MGGLGFRGRENVKDVGSTVEDYDQTNKIER